MKNVPVWAQKDRQQGLYLDQYFAELSRGLLLINL